MSGRAENDFIEHAFTNLQNDSAFPRLKHKLRRRVEKARVDGLLTGEIIKVIKKSKRQVSTNLY